MWSITNKFEYPHSKRMTTSIAEGRWRITVTTSELPAAGTDSRISLTVYGVKGNSGSIPLAAGNTSGNSTVANKDKEKKLFMSGNEDEFVVCSARRINTSRCIVSMTYPLYLF